MHAVVVFIPGVARLRLPCCSQDLLAVCQLHRGNQANAMDIPLGIAADGAEASSRETQRGWKQLLSTNPALFIFALDHFFTRMGRPPETAKELLQWCAGELACCLSSNKFVRKWQPLKKERPTRDAARAWLGARTNKAARQALIDVLLAAIKPDHRKPSDEARIRRWVKCLFGKRLVPPMRGKQHRDQQRSQRAFWKKSRLAPSVIHPKTVRELLRLASTAKERERAFDLRLRTAKLNALKELAYGASHEINNPLANIATGAQVLLKSEPDPDRQQRISRIYAQAMAAHELISDLMLFAHPPMPNFEPTKIRELMRTIAKRHDSDDFAIRVTLGAQVDIADCDANQISIVLEALIRNSKEAIGGASALASAEDSPAEGSVETIELRVDQLAEKLYFSVTDNGPEMDSRTCAHLFDPFYSGREAGRGLGFGLSKAWRIVRMHGGDISFDRDSDKGETTFVFWIPVIQENPSSDRD